MTVTHGLIVGADARWRSSGDIGHKQTVWAMAGVALPSLEIIAKLPAYESYVDHVTSIGFRAQIGRLEIAPQLLHYQQPHSAGAWGITTQMLIRVGKELR